MNFDYFISARYRNKEFASELVRALRQRDYSVYFFAESRASLAYVGAADSNGEIVMQEFEARSPTDPAIKEIFQIDLEALKQARNFILLLPAGQSCHIEAGIAYGLGKHLVLIGKPEKTESLYCIFDEKFLTTRMFLTALKRKLRTS
ncbi:hypothetical protein HYW32_02015 [Candidatus Berkelbacteria bacterium]|nr:hypothetical protein [Candidatus Berkelbacteria bacterium]